MSKRATKVPPEVVQKIQKDFELDNYQFADFFGISLSSALDWLKYGIKNQRGHNIAFIDSLLALQWLADKYPDVFVSKEELKNIVHMIVKMPGMMYIKFLPFKEDLGPSLSVLKHQRLVSVVMATLYVTLLKEMGKKIDINTIEQTDSIGQFY